MPEQFTGTYKCVKCGILTMYEAPNREVYDILNEFKKVKPNKCLCQDCHDKNIITAQN